MFLDTNLNQKMAYFQQSSKSFCERAVVLVPTCNPGPTWPDFLEAIQQQVAQPLKVVILDSESTDGSAQAAQARGHQVQTVSRRRFNHGGTRQQGIEQHTSGAEFVIFLTQDAILADPYALRNLFQAFNDPQVAAAYGRQLPHHNATPIAAHARPAHAGVWHLLAEVEIVFGFWAMILMVVMSFMVGKGEALAYLDSRNFTEPLFVFAIMVVAGSRPVLQAASVAVQAIVRVIPLPRSMAFLFTTLAVVPLLGSFITEPAAMTLAALLLRDGLFKLGISERLKYAVLGVLFVNVSIGGTLTSYAAPPVLMVANVWDWDSAFMFTQFGWKAALAVLVNATVAVYFLRHHLGVNTAADEAAVSEPIPKSIVLVHLGFLAAVVASAAAAVVLW